MAEGKTNMFGKTYNTVGSTDSNFIIKTKGDLKVQWGNKYIDIIKNGKIASEGEKLLFIVNSVEEITKNGVYIVNNNESLEVWLNIDNTKINIMGEEGLTSYISYMINQELTSELQHLALTNIGFYYQNIEDAALANIASGIIYVEDTNKLYIAKLGKLIEYTFAPNTTTEETVEQLTKLEPLYIKEYSLCVGESEYITCHGGFIKLLKPVITYDMIQSEDATDAFGYRLYMDNNKSVFEVDIIKLREYPEYITYAKLEALITDNLLLPKKYYLITDFLNPWEVTWEDEPFLYEDLYEEINKVPYLKGKRNAMQLIVKAKNSNTIEKQAWAPMYPDWIIHYDYTFKGPEYKIVEEGKEVLYYGFRTRESEITNEDGTTKKTTSYLPCKGIITYLKDEYGNEGDFNFRQLMFLHNDLYWRYCVDNNVESTDLYFGEFKVCHNNVFNFKTADTRVLVFIFTEQRDADDNVIGYTVKANDTDIIINPGHALHIFNGEEVSSNVFDFSPIVDRIWHKIDSLHVKNNKFLNIKDAITCNRDIIDNTFENIDKPIFINIPCNGNTIKNIPVEVTIKGIEFNNNELSNFDIWIDNQGRFNNNKILKCILAIVNKGTMENNVINSIEGLINNDLTMSDNIIDTIKSFTNKGQFNNNKGTSIEALTNNSGNINDNTFETITSLTNSSNIERNIFDTVQSLDNLGTIIDNKFGPIVKITNSGTLENNQFNTINDLDNNNVGVIRNNIINYIENKLSNEKTLEGNNINYISTSFTNSVTLLNNIIDVISGNNTIGADLINNTINTLNECTINGLMQNNKFKDLIKNTFTGIILDNIILGNMNDCTIAAFTNNEAYKDLNSVTISTSADSCTFNRPVTDLTATELYYCKFNYITSLELDDIVYHTTFHGSIGNITKEITNHEWLLLKDSSKKKDAYPNIRVICVPEIIKKGMILMWYGKEPIPNGWALCDGKNGTPNLVGSFIKGDSTTANDPTYHEGIDPETNEFTLKEEHLPKHSHPHKEHTHDISDITGTADASTVTVRSDSTWGYYDSTVDVSSGVEGATDKTVINDITYRNVVGTDTGSHTHDITISGGSIEKSTSIEKEKEWSNTPIKLEPKHFKIIFIMKIDDDIEES